MARYGASHVLDLRDVSVNGGALPVRDDDGLHVAAYLADVSGDGVYGQDDIAQLGELLVRRGTGFAAYPLTDPVTIGNALGNGYVNGLDARLLSFVLAGTAQSYIPARPVLPALSGDEGGSPQAAVAAATSPPSDAPAPSVVFMTAPRAPDPVSAPFSPSCKSRGFASLDATVLRRQSTVVLVLHRCRSCRYR